MFNYGIVGSSGRMGAELKRAFDAEGNSLTLEVWDSGENYISDPQVIVDFSRPEVLPATVELCRKYNCGAVIGTTGLKEQEIDQLKELAEVVPVVQSFNFSIGVNMMAMILAQYAPLMENWQAEMLEIHHRHKVDAPSGTAFLLERAMGREIPIHSMRIGGIPGDHSVCFANDGEMLEITHRAISRSVFAIGAYEAAKFVTGAQKGFYDFREVLECTRKML